MVFKLFKIFKFKIFKNLSKNLDIEKIQSCGFWKNNCSNFLLNALPLLFT